MNVLKGFEELVSIPNPVLTIGTFDGVHLGHQKIIRQLKNEAQKIGGQSVLFTFYPHPRMVLYPESHGLRLIQTQAEKLAKLERAGLDNVIVFPFTMEFSRLTALEFVRDFLLNRLKMQKLVIGYDHQFGKNREGSIDFLREISETYDFEVIEISAKEIDEVNISSSKIRRAILGGDIQKANKYLGEPFELSGTVVHGKALGRSIGFPTANLEIGDETKLIPMSGVYAVNVKTLDGRIHNGMMNIGLRPTLGDQENRFIEVHVFDLNENLYGQELTVQLLARFRDERKFESLSDLKEQLSNDENSIRNFFISV